MRVWHASATTTKEDGPALAAIMTRHTGAVLCVRWSPKGRYLASSADDSLVLIWQRAEYSIWAITGTP